MKFAFGMKVLRVTQNYNEDLRRFNLDEDVN